MPLNGYLKIIYPNIAPFINPSLLDLTVKTAMNRGKHLKMKLFTFEFLNERLYGR